MQSDMADTEKSNLLDESGGALPSVLDNDPRRIGCLRPQHVPIVSAVVVTVSIAACFVIFYAQGWTALEACTLWDPGVDCAIEINWPVPFRAVPWP